MLMRDPYAVLGVRRDAGQDEIRTAWRTLAKAVHPDQNQDDPFAEIRFTEAGRAYELLRDPAKRSLYDKAHRETELRREAALRRMEQMRRQQSQRKAEQEPASAPAGDETAEDMISRIFGVEGKQTAESKTVPDIRTAPAPRNAEPAGEKPAAASSRTDEDEDGRQQSASRSAAPAAALISAIVNRIRGLRRKPDRAPDLHRDVTVTIADILNRAKVNVDVAEGQSVKVALQPGATEGQVIRLREQGHRILDMKAGDLVLTLRVAAGRFRVDGFDLATDLAVTIENAVLGWETTIEGPDGRRIPVSVPAWSGSDKVLRIEGEGLADESGRRGDLVVEIRLMLHEKPDDKIIDLMRVQREGLYL